MIVFRNAGEIDVRAISTFGISAKVGDSPIGFFGTGLKYAIAVLLREKQAITICSGNAVYLFSLERSEMRGKEFDLVMMSRNGAPAVSLGFTTELGRNWKLWMAYRELACNCMDESGTISAEMVIPDTEEGKTTIGVFGSEFAECYANRSEYILSGNADYIMGSIEVRRRQSASWYYRGVSVMHMQKPSWFSYNDLAATELTEDRTVKTPWLTQYRLALAVLDCDDPILIRQIITAPEDFMEHGLDFEGRGTPSGAFLQAVGECASDRLCKVNETALRVWKEATKEAFAPRETELTDLQKGSMERALTFCGSIGFPVRGSYPIRVVESLGDGVLGLALDETIFIAERCFHMGGAKQVASCLIEEYLHLKHNWKDMSRELQSFLFEKIVSIGEELNGEAL